VADSLSAADLAIGERIEGPIFQAADGRRMDRHGAARIVHRTARRAGIAKNVGPHTLRHAFITAALDAGVPLRDAQEAASHADPRTADMVGSLAVGMTPPLRPLLGICVRRASVGKRPSRIAPRPSGPSP
jgi:integrase